MRRWVAGVVAAALIVAAAVIADRTVVPASETSALSIAGAAPHYGPGTVSAVPNGAAALRRLWVPGLDSGYDPQGLAVDGGDIYVSGYVSREMSVHRGPCPVFRLDPASGAPTGRLDLPATWCHAGGLALGGDGMLYIADTHTLYATPLAGAFAADAAIRRFPLGPGVTGALAVSTADGIWLGTYAESGSGRLYRFAAATLAGLHDGETLAASRAAAELPIPDHAQGAAFGADALWVARSTYRWGTLDRLEPATGAPLRRYAAAPGIEGLAFDAGGRLWAVSEAGARHFYDHPLAGLVEPFYPLVVALDLSRLE